jgi:lysophospholipase L1-like esterase
MMRLTFDQIKAVTFGSVKTEQTETGIRFAKCTQKQIDAWYRESETLGQRAETTTGVRLDFYTNSKNIAFCASEGNKFELHIDGLLRKQFKMNECEGGVASLDLTDPLGEFNDSVRVTLHLPSHEKGSLSWVELDDGATVVPHRFDAKILFIGDSITQGWQSMTDTYSYAYRVSSFFNAESVIQGIGGAYFNENSFDSLPFDPDTVIVAYGTNDFGHYKTQDDMRAHVRAHLALIAKEYEGKRIFVISPIWRGVQQKPMGTFAECRKIVVEEAARLRLVHIDGLSLVPPLPELFPNDLLHPDELGFSLYAENLIAKMTKI